ncbi:MAG: hypothetical protein AAF968_14395 [Pseudomonadota bacterium]
MRVYGRVIVDPRSRSGIGRVVELVVDVVRHATFEVRFHNAEAGIASDNSLLAWMQNYASAGWVARIYWVSERLVLSCKHPRWTARQPATARFAAAFNTLRLRPSTMRTY